MSRKLLHYAPGYFSTACGRSTHGWQGARTPASTSDIKRVECARCLAAMKKARVAK